MTAIASSTSVGARICEALGLRPDRTASLRIDFPPQGAIQVHAVLYADELQMDAVTGELEVEMKSFELTPIKSAQPS